MEWPLWQCISDEALINLILYQWDNYGMKLDLLMYFYTDMESIEEIDRLLRQRPHYRKRAI